MSKVLIVEDELSIAELEKDYLELSSFEVEIETDGQQGLEKALKNDFDMIILDIMLPGVDGFEICKQIREAKEIPILMVSARKEDIDKIRGLGLGADDYICKPFGVMELRARIGAHLRREKREHVARLALGRICFMLEARKMMIDEKEISLTKAEYDICEFLAKNRGQIFSKEQILEKVLGYDSESSDSTIITHIKNIRTKLSSFEYMPIKTVWGIGYKWEE